MDLPLFDALDDGSKVCTRCKIKKLIVEFSPRNQKRGTSDRRSWCKACCSEASRAWAKEHGHKRKVDRSIDKPIDPKRHEIRICKACGSNMSRVFSFCVGKWRWKCYACSERWTKKNRERASGLFRARHLMKKFGLTVDEYDLMSSSQGGLCAICQMPESKLSKSGKISPLAVDHDHKKKGRESMRGLLCRACNWAIERLEEVPGWSDKALAYLARFE